MRDEPSFWLSITPITHQYNVPTELRTLTSFQKELSEARMAFARKVSSKGYRLLVLKAWSYNIKY